MLPLTDAIPEAWSRPWTIGGSAHVVDVGPGGEPAASASEGHTTDFGVVLAVFQSADQARDQIVAERVEPLWAVQCDQGYAVVTLVEDDRGFRIHAEFQSEFTCTLEFMLRAGWNTSLPSPTDLAAV